MEKKKKAIIHKRYIVASANKGEFCISDKKMEKTGETDEGWKSESEVYTFQSPNIACGNVRPPYSKALFELIQSICYEAGTQIEVEYIIKTV